MADEFEIGKEEIVVLLLVKTRPSWRKWNFLYCYMQKRTLTGQIFHTGNIQDLIWCC